MQVTEHVHALRIPFQINLSPEKSLDRFVYCFLIYGKEGITLVDSGVASAEEIIFNYVVRTGRRVEEIKKLILTHSHPDHLGAAKKIKDITNCSILAHSGEKNWIEDVELQFKERPVPGFHNLVGGSVSLDRILEEGDIITLEEGLQLEVLHTPGHSKGSISLILTQDNLLFSGDAIILPGDLPIYEDYSALIGSLQKIQKLEKIKHLLASWDEPREANEVYQTVRNSLSYLERINQIIAQVVEEAPGIEPMELTKRVVHELGMPPISAVPMLAKSFMANLKELG